MHAFRKAEQSFDLLDYERVISQKLCQWGIYAAKGHAIDSDFEYMKHILCRALFTGTNASFDRAVCTNSPVFTIPMLLVKNISDNKLFVFSMVVISTVVISIIFRFYENKVDIAISRMIKVFKNRINN